MKIFRYFGLRLSLAMLLTACMASRPGITAAEPSQAPTWQEQYDLGVRYLSEGNYQEAVIAFTVAIEIDPKQAPAYVGRGDAYVLSGETDENLTAAKADYEKAIELDETSVEAYLGLADVYIRQGDYEKALEILREATGKTIENQSILNKIEEIELAQTLKMKEDDDYSFFFTNDFVKPQDWTVNGKPIYKCELADFQVEFPNGNQNYPSINFEGDGWCYVPHWPGVNDNTNVVVNKLKSSLFYSIHLSGQTGEDIDFFFQPNFRGINIHDSYSEILRKLGFSDIGIQYLSEVEDGEELEYKDGQYFRMHLICGGINGDRPGNRIIYLYYDEKESSEVWYNIVFYFSFLGDKLDAIDCTNSIFYPRQ